MKSKLLICLILPVFLSCKKNKTDIVAEPVQHKIYYQGSPVGTIGPEEIYSMNEDGSGERALTDFSGGGSLNIFTGEPAYSASDKRIYFISQKDFPGGELFSMNTDGSAVTRNIGNNIPRSSMHDPFLYQNGQKVIYTMQLDSFANRHQEIYTADINGNNKMPLTNNPAGVNSSYPCVIPGDSAIVYVHYDNGRAELYSMLMNGSNKRALTSTGPAIKSHPQFSPDAKKIVFDALVGIGTEIFIMNADGTNMTQLTFYTANGTKDIYSWGATFSSDGNTIYFTSDEFNGTTSQIYKMKTDGTSRIKITTSAVDKFNPCVK
jgi:Tol biopolymer transport system component